MKTLIKILCLSVLWFSCESDVSGCTDMEACNYDSNANSDDNTCEYESCIGCTDLYALNYNSYNKIDDGSCQYADYSIEITDTMINNRFLVIDVGETIQWNNKTNYLTQIQFPPSDGGWGSICFNSLNDTILTGDIGVLGFYEFSPDTTNIDTPSWCDFIFDFDIGYSLFSYEVILPDDITYEDCSYIDVQLPNFDLLDTTCTNGYIVLF